MKTLIARALRACMFVMFAAGSTTAPAAEEPRGAMTLAQAVEAALAHNPELQASRYELTAAQARVTRAGSRLNPQLSLELENFAGSGETRGSDALETTLSLSQVIELGDKRALRRVAAEGDSDLVEMDRRARQLDVLAEVTRRYVDVVVAQERLRYAEENTALATRTFEAIDGRVRAARSPLAESSRAKIAVTRAIIEKRQGQLALETARSALAMTWGSVEPRFTTAAASLYSFESVEPFEALRARLERNPDVARFVTDARLRDAELRLAQAQSRPNLSLSLGIRRFQQAGDLALVAGFSMPLGVFDRNEGGIREAHARRTQSEAQQKAATTRAQGTLFALYQAMVAARERAESLQLEAIPQARDAFEQTQYGYERGRFSFLELLTSQQDVLALQEAAIDAAADYHRLLAEIERITSEPLTTSDLEATLP